MALVPTVSDHTWRSWTANTPGISRRLAFKELKLNPFGTPAIIEKNPIIFCFLSQPHPEDRCKTKSSGTFQIWIFPKGTQLKSNLDCFQLKGQNPDFFGCFSVLPNYETLSLNLVPDLTLFRLAVGDLGSRVVSPPIPRSVSRTFPSFEVLLMLKCHVKMVLTLHKDN